MPTGIEIKSCKLRGGLAFGNFQERGEGMDRLRTQEKDLGDSVN